VAGPGAHPGRGGANGCGDATGEMWDAIPLQAAPLDPAAEASETGGDDGPWTVAMPLELEASPWTGQGAAGSQPSTGSGGALLLSPGADDLASRRRVLVHERLGALVQLAALPLDTLFAFTCPECAHDGPNAAWYPLTFVVSFTWVSAFSMVVSSVVSHWGELSGVPPSFLGLAIIAIGAEVPDTIQSVTVARRGYGSMAVSNSFGSQIINILIGLGMPWTMSCTAGQPIALTDVAHIRIMGCIQAVHVAVIFSALLGVAFAGGHTKAVLSKGKGAGLLAMYAAGVAFYALIVFHDSGAAAGALDRGFATAGGSTAASTAAPSPTAEPLPPGR